MYEYVAMFLLSNIFYSLVPIHVSGREYKKYNKENWKFITIKHDAVFILYIL